jgi:hypothetical protein
MTSSSQQLATKTVLKGQNSYSVSYGKLDTKYPERRLRSAKTKSNMWGSTISQDHQNLGAERKQAVRSIPTPTTRQICEFLGEAGFCQIWIPNFSLLAKSLYEAIKEGKREPLIWESKQQQSFRATKEALISAPALGLPNVRKPFFLYVHERSFMTIGVLTQYVDSCHRPVAISPSSWIQWQWDSLPACEFSQPQPCWYQRQKN